MNQGTTKNFMFALSELSRWVVPLLIVWLLVSIGLGWVVKSILIILALIAIAPVVAFVGLRWWLKRNIIIDRCPVCSYEITGLNQTQFQCPSCGEPLKGAQDHFERLTPPGTIEVDAVEVSPKTFEGSR
ncbi:hypothetical protein [Phormidium sp. CCY1219]|uniref:hypothetical protein n=1 Tax=Phormidium sp. CCY1219 TaxID=2886104 RepID=UPI002D1EDC53|nr:hypothetical protein [Phormidium sp. CCY1219]MEB3830642.1 hypothetical protein [Phormidium sp. CCY1219]